MEAGGKHIKKKNYGQSEETGEEGMSARLRNFAIQGTKGGWSMVGEGHSYFNRNMSEDVFENSSEGENRRAYMEGILQEGGRFLSLKGAKEK